MNVIARLEYELAHYDSTVHRFNHYTMRTPPTEFSSIRYDSIRWYQSGPGNNGNERVPCIPKSSSITGTSLSDCLVSYPEHSLGGSYSSSKMQSVFLQPQLIGPIKFKTLAFETVIDRIYIYIYIYIYMKFKSEHNSLTSRHNIILNGFISHYLINR